ncbi:nucleotide-binding protein [Henriciella litoralis]|uniref:nucleotide-binding protein n=1 Tax=Henriciella litoralis TaxID=568102 RepID=UPI0009FCC9C6|nr:AAA family ATPase [Henriciella litoralis]
MSFMLPKSMDRSNRLPKTPQRRVEPGTIIAVASGKGGVGKTFMSITLASAFANLGERTLLVDGDLGLANVDVQLGIAPETDLAAVIAGWIELEDAVINVDGGAGKGGFDVLPGRSGSGALAELSPEEVARLAAGLSSLSLQYDKIVLDLGAGIEANCMRLARAADKALMVITDDPSSMTDGYAFIKVLRGYAPDVEQHIAINQAPNRATGQQTYEAIAMACRQFLGFRPTLAGVVMRDEKVREAVRRQRTLISTDPKAQPIQDAIAIAQTFVTRGKRPHLPI